VAPLLAEPLGAKPPCDLPGLARVPDRRLQRERQARARLDAALPQPAARPRRGSRKDTSSQSWSGTRRAPVRAKVGRTPHWDSGVIANPGSGRRCL